MRKIKENESQPRHDGSIRLVGMGLFVMVVVAICIYEPPKDPARPEKLSDGAISPKREIPSFANHSGRSHSLNLPTPSIEDGVPKQLVADLSKLSDTRGVISAKDAEEFKGSLAELVRRGAASVPAIQEFLDKNLDSDFMQLDGGDQLGYSSLRASLFETLMQIGGPEAEAATLKTLQTTSLPSEILELSKNLEELAPGQYRDQIVAAARESLAMASANQLGDNVEVGPVFRVLESYGEAPPRNAPSKDSEETAAP